MFYGRGEELSSLEERYARGKFEFVPIYGRRRVGKTTLIKEFIKDKDSFYFMAVDGDLEDNLALMAHSLFGYPMDAGSPGPEYIVEELFRRAADRRFVVVIDEYSRICRDSKRFSDALQGAIDDHKGESKMFLILCGSSISLMEHEVLGYSSPLYGRRTGSLRLKPFDFFGSRHFLAGFSEEDKVRIYGITGGVPLYLEQFDGTRTLEENIMDGFMRNDSFFYDEPKMVLLEEFRNPLTFQRILLAVSKGKSTVTDISKAARMDSTLASKHLADLVSVGLVRKLHPVDNPDGRMTRYLMGDPFLGFYYRNRMDRFDGLTEQEMREETREVLKIHEEKLGPVFERISAEFIRRTRGGSPGTWWGSDPQTKRSEEIDIVMTKVRDGIRHGLFVECNYGKEPVGLDVLDTLVRRSFLVKGYDSREYALCSKSGFTENLSKREDVELLTLDDMVRRAESEGWY